MGYANSAERCDHKQREAIRRGESHGIIPEVGMAKKAPK